MPIPAHIQQKIKRLRADALAQGEPQLPLRQALARLGVDRNGTPLSPVTVRHTAATGFRFDHPDHLACTNGWVDLRTGALTAWRGGERPERCCPVEFNRRATSPAWTKFIGDITQSHRATIRLLQRFAGYAATGYTHEARGLVITGVHSAGKTVFISALRRALGDYAIQAEPEQFDIPRCSTRSRFALSRLDGARLVTIDAVGPHRDAPAGLKALIHGEAVEVERPYENPRIIRLVGKLILIADDNFGPTASLCSRLSVVTFRRKLPGFIKLYDDQIDAAILAWIVAGAVAWNASGFRDLISTPTARKA